MRIIQLVAHRLYATQGLNVWPMSSYTATDPHIPLAATAGISRLPLPASAFATCSCPRGQGSTAHSTKGACSTMYWESWSESWCRRGMGTQLCRLCNCFPNAKCSSGEGATHAHSTAGREGAAQGAMALTSTGPGCLEFFCPPVKLAEDNTDLFTYSLIAGRTSL